MGMGSGSGLRLMGSLIHLSKIRHYILTAFVTNAKTFEIIFFELIFEHSALHGSELFSKLCSPPFCEMLNNQSRKPKQNETKRNEGNTTNNNMTSILTLG
jgi:hypothetical protein